MKKDSRYKRYCDCSIDELEEIVNDLENISISALKSKKLDIRKTILSSVKEAKKEIEKRLKK
jgi:methyl coenzyme M reductase alpha subunit